MQSFHGTAGVALLLLGGGALVTASARSVEDEQRLESALGVELLGAGRLDELGTNELQRLAAATDVDVEALAGVELWEALTEDDRLLWIALRELPGAGQERAVVLALGEESAFGGAGVLGADEQPLDEWTHFLDSFRFYDVPRISGARPRAHLTQVRDRTREAQEEDERATFALLEVLGAMHRQAAPFNLPAASKTRAPAEEAEDMALAYEHVEELAGPLSPLLVAKTEDFARIAGDSAETARAMAAAWRAQDAPAAEKLQRRLLANCRGCHQLDVPELGGELKDVLPGIRRERGIGDGFYQIGHDVRIRHADRERAQRVADGLREAALALDLALAR